MKLVLAYFNNSHQEVYIEHLDTDDLQGNKYSLVFYTATF